MPDLEPVQIGVRELYEELIGLRQEVVALRAELARRGDADERRDADLDDHESRIRNLERRQWPLPSAAAIIALAGLILGLVQLLQ
ncbi:hypothetical protein [Salininema proteolyticum]|uniref:DUF883 domain-containing protein n=1 Tax=Salininema proteolyticum TaxID=1607685 RepID=A0ABV8TWQ0_9ACTN